MTFFVDALVVGLDAGDAIAIEQKFRTGEARKDGDSSLLHFAAQPLHKAVQRDDIVAMIAQKRGSDQQFELALLSEEVDRFLGNLGVEWSFFFKSRKQFAHGTRVKQRAGKAVLPNLPRLLQHVDIFFAELRVRMGGIVSVNRTAPTAAHTPCPQGRRRQ